MQDKDKQAYEQLILGIQGYIEKCLDNSYGDKTTTAMIKYAEDEDLTEYTISIDGQIYHHIPTIGGICSNNEIVRVLIPQGNYSNMFILKGGQGGGNITVNTNPSGGDSSPTVISVNGKVGDVVLNAQDVGALSFSDVETEDIDFSTLLTK